MANTTIYPYGTNGQLPSSIGVINDLTTGGADKALSAEQGKILGEYADIAMDCVGYSIVIPSDLTVDSGKRLGNGTSAAYPTNDANYNVLKTLTLQKGETVYFTTSGMKSNYAVIAKVVGSRYACLVAGDGGTNTTYSYTATSDMSVAFCYKAGNTYTIKVESTVVNTTTFNEVKTSAATSAVSSVYLDTDASYSLSAEQTKSNALWSETFDGTLKKGGRYVIHLSGTAALTYAGNYISLKLTGINSGKSKTVFYISKANSDTFSEQDVVIYPLEDSTLSVEARYNLKLTIKGSGTYSQTVNKLIPDQVPESIFESATLWPKYTTIPIRSFHDMSWHNGNLWAFNKYADGYSFVYNSSNAEIKRFKVDLNETRKDSSTSAIENKSVDWHEQKNLLLIGNGKSSFSSSDSYCYIFYEAEDWLEATGDITFSNCGEYAKIDFTDLGYKCYGYWAYDNNADTMFVSVNIFKDIYLVQLGKGTNDLSQLDDGGGTYAAASTGKYNGSWVILNHWRQSEYAGTYSDHGGQFYGGYLYLGDNRADMARVFRITLCDDGTMKWQKIRFGAMLSNGSGISEGYVDGLCIKDGKMWVNILNYSTQTNRNITAIADII